MNILDLPSDILLNILQRLDLRDLANLIGTCQEFRSFLVNADIIWRKIGRDYLVVEDPLRYGECFSMSWYDRCKISNNWRWGLYNDRVVVRFDAKYMPWMSFQDSENIILSKGNKLQCYTTIRKKTNKHDKDMLWSVAVPTVARNDIRTNDISRFVIRNNLLICGNRDGGSVVYKIPNLTQEPELLCHIKNCHEDGHLEVSAVELIGYRNHHHIVTGSTRSPCLLFWHIDENNPKTRNNIMGIPIRHAVGVKCMSIGNCLGKLAVGLDGNSMPNLFDMRRCRYLFDGEDTKNPHQAVRDVGWHNENTLMYVTHSGNLHLLDLRIQSNIYNARDPFLSTLYCVKSDGNNAIIAGSSEYARCVLFDARNYSKHVQIYFTHKRLSSPVYCLDFDSTTLLAAVDRGISLLNFNVNKSTLQSRDYSQVFQQIYAE